MVQKCKGNLGKLVGGEEYLNTTTSKVHNFWGGRNPLPLGKCGLHIHVPSSRPGNNH